MDILLNQSFEIDNLVSLSGKFNFNDYQKAINDITNYYKEYKKCDNFIITTTKSIEIVNGEQILDVEILLPICNNNVLVNKPYIYKSSIKVTNALYNKTGDVTNLQNILNELNQYIYNNNLQPITSAYLIQKKIDNIHCVEIYIGINPNIL